MAFVLALLEIAVFLTAILLYLYDIPQGFNAAMETRYWAFAAGGVAFVNVIFIAIMLFRISAIRQKSDLKAADIIGADVQEAYNFGKALK